MAPAPRLLLAVAVGAAAGGVARYLLTTAIQARLGGFPWGTLAVNGLGALVLGVLLKVAVGNPAVPLEWRLLLTTGFCGGFTTFSAFSAETVELLRAGAVRRAAVYVVLSVALSLVALAAGYAAAPSAVQQREPDRAA